MILHSQNLKNDANLPKPFKDTFKEGIRGKTLLLEHKSRDVIFKGYVNRELIPVVHNVMGKFKLLRCSSFPTNE